MEDIAIVVLAAGKGKRMGQDKPKVLTTSYSNLTLIEHVLGEALSLKPKKLVVVTGHASELVQQEIANSKYLQAAGLKQALLSYALQKEQLGTGDAVKAALPYLKGFKGTIIILYGDVPLLKASTIAGLLDLHAQKKATLSLIILKNCTANNYGRIIKNAQGQIEKIVEFKDCTPSEKLIDQTNTGIYAVDSAFLEPALLELKPDNAQAEYYLTDIVAKASKEGQAIMPLYLSNSVEVQGVNTVNDLEIINCALRAEKVKNLQAAGVIFKDTSSVFIDNSVIIEAGVIIGPNVILLGETHIKSAVVLEGTNYINNSSIAENALIRFAVKIEDATIGAETKVGPFAHLRPKTNLSARVQIGNFVEVKNSSIAAGSKANHLAYLGDAEIGKNVNIGAGTITANYDGVNKHKSIIADDVFVGSNSVLVAPIEVGKMATIGAGSVVAKKVEAGCLTVTRADKIVKKDWKRPSK